ncbi:hypothetical protein BGX20_005760 [Mortierella sp. AD010]|nr:hypothetical protein BGX20_005760 [Mortierella sp. AD010]
MVPLALMSVAPKIKNSLKKDFDTDYGATVYTQSIYFCSFASYPVAQSTTTLEVCFPVLPSALIGYPFGFTVSATNGIRSTLFYQAAVITATNY